MNKQDKTPLAVASDHLDALLGEMAYTAGVGTHYVAVEGHAHLDIEYSMDIEEYIYISLTMDAKVSIERVTACSETTYIKHVEPRLTSLEIRYFLDDDIDYEDERTQYTREQASELYERIEAHALAHHREYTDHIEH